MMEEVGPMKSSQWRAHDTFMQMSVAKEQPSIPKTYS